jgi:LysM repeat protein
MYPMSDHYPPLLAERGHPTANIAMLREAFQALTKVALAQAPAESFGALVGKSSQSSRFGSASANNEIWGVIEEVTPVKLVAVQTGLAPDMQEWAALETRLAGSADEKAQSILGWFYADPAIGIFKPRANVMQVAGMLATGGSLLLVVNPVAGQGTFYVKQGDHFAPTGGFHEVLAEEDAQPVIPWTGEVQGAQQWLERSYTTYTLSAENTIEDYTFFDDGDNSNTGTIRPATRNEQTTAPTPHATQEAESTAPTATEVPGTSNKVGEPPEAPDLNPDESVPTVNWDSDISGSLDTFRRSGPATAPLPPLADNTLRLAPLSEAGTDAHDWSQEVEPAGQAGQAKGRGWLPALGAVLGIAVVVALAGSAMLQTMANGPPATVQTPTMPVGGGVSQTVTAPAAVAATSPTATPSLAPTHSALVPTQTPTEFPTRTATALTATPSDTLTDPLVSTSTATTEPTATPIPTTQPEATPTATAEGGQPATTTYVVQAGDSLNQIAERFGTTVDATMTANNLTSTIIRVGQVLIIP